MSYLNSLRTYDRANNYWPRYSRNTSYDFRPRQRPNYPPSQRPNYPPSQRPNYPPSQRPNYRLRQRPLHDLVDLDDSEPDLDQPSGEVLTPQSSSHQSPHSSKNSSSESLPLELDGQSTASSHPQLPQDKHSPDVSSPTQNSQLHLIDTSKALANNLEMKLDKIVCSLRKGINCSRKREQGSSQLAQQNLIDGLKDLETLCSETSKFCELSRQNAEFTSSLINDLSVLKISVTSLQEDSAADEENFRFLKEENTRLQNDLEAMRTERSSLSQHASSLKEQLSTSRIEITRLNSDLEKSSAETSSLSKKLIRAQLDQLPSHRDSHQAEISQLQSVLKERTAERDLLIKRLSELNTNLPPSHSLIPPTLISNSTQTVPTDAQNAPDQEDLKIMTCRLVSLENTTVNFFETIKKDHDHLATIIQNLVTSLQASSSSQHKQSQEPHHLKVLIEPNSTAKNNIPAFRSTTKSTLNNLTSDHFKIIGTNDLKDGSIAITCSKQSDPQKLNLLLSQSDALKETANLSIKNPATIKLIIKELPLDTPKELILSTLHSLGSSSPSIGNTFYYKQSKAFSQVINVEKDIAKSLMERVRPTILIGNSSFPVAFYIHYYRCANCQEFGHLAKNCPNSTLICASCGRDNHSTEKCYHKDNPSYHFCTNCDYHNSLNPANQINPYHQASSRSCFCFKHYVKEQTKLCFSSLFKYSNRPPGQPL